MKEPLEIVMYRNTEIEIHQDNDAQNPNSWDNEIAFLIYDHRDFATAPYGMNSSDVNDIFKRFADLKMTCYHDKKSWWIIPVYAYIHIGVSLYLNRRTAMQYDPSGFDTSLKGFILVDKMHPERYSIEDAYKIAQDVIVEWNIYLNGEVYGYICKHGSCWGFYGDDGKKQMIKEAKEEIDYAMKQKMLTKIHQTKSFIRNKVPLAVRQRRTISVD